MTGEAHLLNYINYKIVPMYSVFSVVTGSVLSILYTLPFDPSNTSKKYCYPPFTEGAFEAQKVASVSSGGRTFNNCQNHILHTYLPD